MAKRFFALFTAMLLLFGTLLLPASAAEEGTSVVSAYYQDGQIYLFLDTPTPAPYSADLTVGDTVVGTELMLHSTSLGTLYTDYLFLVDTSIQPSLLTHLTEGLRSGENQESAFGLATYGSQFQLHTEGFSTRFMLWVNAASSLESVQPGGDICDGIQAAIDCLRSTPREAGHLTNIILISANAAISADQPDSEESLRLNGILAQAPDILLHTIIIDAPTTGRSEASTPRRPIYTLSNNDQDAVQSIGTSIAQSAGALKWVSHGINGIGTIEPNTTQLVLSYGDGSQETITVESVPDPSTLYHAEQAPTEATGSAEVPQEGNPTEAPGGSTIDLNNNDEEKEGFSLGGLIWLLVGILLLAGAGAAFFLLRWKKPAPDQYQGIPVGLEIISGRCKNPRQKLYLNQELLVGSDPSCHLVWRDPSVTPRHCRIFLRDGQIWIEDLNERSTTFVDGIKIYAPNCLHSEDVIRIGKVRFKLLF